MPTSILRNSFSQATEPIVAAACAFKRPFAVVPCCVFPRKFPHRFLVQDTGERVPVVTYEQVSPPRRPSAAMSLQLTNGSSPAVSAISAGHGEAGGRHS